ncbi:MAG: hypothetical protein JST84_11805 [Acidobacteria bacterium]|nr:hypothetical protein [Acidobacteriota bacterium]
MSSVNLLSRSLIKRSSSLIGWLVFLNIIICAETLPIKTYTAVDGLPQNNINQIVFDSRGFIWFCTNEGFARFDGYKFTNYGVEQGLPHRNVNDLIETRSGDYWLATNSGLVRFFPQGNPNQAAKSNGRFLAYNLTNERSGYMFSALLEDRAGRIWCGTETGLLRLEKVGSDYALHPTELWQRDNKKYSIEGLLEDRNGILWAGSYGKIFRIFPDGTREQYGELEGLPNIEIKRLYEDREGKIWAGTGKGLLQLEAHPKSGQRLVKQTISTEEGLPGAWVRDVWQAADGAYWAATDRGLCRLVLSTNGAKPQIMVYTKDYGLSDYYIKRVVGDRFGNMWIGTANAGVMKWFIDGFTTFGYQDGAAAVISVREGSNGEIFLAGYAPEKYLAQEDRTLKKSAAALHWRLGKYENGQFIWVRPNVPSKVQFSLGWNQISFQDRQGEWWIATQSGLFRFPRVARFEDLASIAPKAIYTTQNGLSNNNITRLFEDAKGDIWIANTSREHNNLDRWERATNRIHQLNLDALKNRPVSALVEDRDGNLWLGLSGNVVPGGLARYRNGVITDFSDVETAPHSSVYDLLLDTQGKLWMASGNNGASYISVPNAEQLDFTRYSTANGLTSNRVMCLAEDKFGRIYLGTGKGVDQLDQKTGRIRHFSPADGLALGSVDDILHDHDGTLWFATTQGFSRFTPKPDPPTQPPLILIDTVRIGGQVQPISALGAIEVSLPTINASEGQIEINYVGLSFAPGDPLSYQSKLEGVEENWQLPTKQRAINFANLAPGYYRFLVRAINADGIESTLPASVSFRVAAPVYRRWWFIALCASAICGLAYAAYRYRVQHLLALERMRMRIATDLHDEVGSSLSQIAILSEVARQRLAPERELTTITAKEPLEKVAVTSREALDAMSDLVWAINPKRDQLSDLSQRMRRFASDTLTAKDIVLRFHAPDAEVSLDADVRRQVFLIFKEAINNIVRHADATDVEVLFMLHDQHLSLRLKDNGCGFVETNPHPRQNGGNGLESMQRRAKELGGTLMIISDNGNGTLVQLDVPLRPRRKK